MKEEKDLQPWRGKTVPLRSPGAETSERQRIKGEKKNKEKKKSKRKKKIKGKEENKHDGKGNFTVFQPLTTEDFIYDCHLHKPETCFWIREL